MRKKRCYFFFKKLQVARFVTEHYGRHYELTIRNPSRNSLWSDFCQMTWAEFDRAERTFHKIHKLLSDSRAVELSKEIKSVVFFGEFAQSLMSRPETILLIEPPSNRYQLFARYTRRARARPSNKYDWLPRRITRAANIKHVPVVCKFQLNNSALSWRSYLRNVWWLSISRDNRRDNKP